MNEREWVRLLRWYPPEWRERNAAAMAGALMDEAEASGRSRPTASDRFHLVVGGMRERVVAPERPSGLSLAALIGGVAFSAFYLGVIAWAPGVRFAGTVGPFTNPSIVTGVLLAPALAFALLGRAGAARLLAWLAVVAATMIGALGIGLSWLGPGIMSTTLFAGIALLATSRVRGKPNGTLLALAVMLVAIAVAAAQLGYLAGVNVLLTTVEWALAGASMIAAAALVLVAFARKHGDPRRDAGGRRASVGS